MARASGFSAGRGFDGGCSGASGGPQALKRASIVKELWDPVLDEMDARKAELKRRCPRPRTDGSRHFEYLVAFAAPAGEIPTSNKTEQGHWGGTASTAPRGGRRLALSSGHTAASSFRSWGVRSRSCWPCHGRRRRRSTSKTSSSPWASRSWIHVRDDSRWADEAAGVVLYAARARRGGPRPLQVPLAGQACVSSDSSLSGLLQSARD